MLTDTTNRHSLLADQGYFRAWVVGALTGIIRWLELLAYGLYAWDLTASPVLVALLALLRFMPLALFGVFIGALADLFDARRLLIWSLLAIIAVNLAMLALFIWGEPQYWHIAAATILAGLFWAGDMPLRRRMIGDLVPPERLAEAMSLDNATSNGTRALGPLCGGLIYQVIGIAGTFALGIVLYAASLAITLTVAYASTPDAAQTGARLLRPVTGAWKAFRYACGNSDVLRILAVTAVFNIWGFPFVAMIPVIGKQELGLSAAAIGIVSSLEGAMALAAAVIIARTARPRQFRRIYFYGTFAHLMAVFFIGATSGLWLLVAGLMMAGLFAAGLATMQSTLIYATAPREMRGRFLGLMTICIGTGLIGFANVGITAELVGASNALMIIAAEGVIPMLLIAWKWRELNGDH